MGNPTLIIFLVTLVVFVIAYLVLTKIFDSRQVRYRKRSLESIARGDEFDVAADVSGFVDEDVDSFGEAMQGAPVIGKIYVKLRRSGSKLKLLPYLGILLLVFVVVFYLANVFFKGILPLSLGAGLFAMYVFNNIYLGTKLEKRNELFLHDFPDAIDMIVRSVRSGHPLLMSLKLIAQNSRPPLSLEFQRVIDEVSYGRPLPESLRKMADRIGILDVNFFVVILSVQQETGGSMAEVLSNLSNIIRKRKQLRLKIRALTSEGRITTWIFSCIPFFQIGAVYFVARDYLDPLFETTPGLICLAVSLSFISLAIYIARQLCKMDI